MFQCYSSVWFIAVTGLQNLALNKPAWQHGTYDGNGASRAVDGNANPSLDAGSCAHTDRNQYRTWGVDLQMQAWVAYVEVMRRDNLVHGMLMEYEFVFAQGKFWIAKIW